MGGRIMCLASLMVALLFVSMAEAQSSSGFPSCAQELIPCADYLNSTNPPASCCDPLKKTVANELTCLCNLFYSPGLLQSFNISVDQALKLSQRCGVTSDISNCNRAGSAPPTGSVAPPATRGGDSGSDAGRVSFTGFSFLLLLWASMSMLFN